MMVMHSNNPKNTCTRHAHKPPKISQRRFSGRRMQPVGLEVSITSAPKGHRHSNPNLNVCNATGMPIMVNTITRLPEKYPMAASRPPNNSHNKFPMIRIVCKFFSFRIDYVIPSNCKSTKNLRKSKAECQFI